MTDEQLRRLMQSALPAMDSARGPRDAWRVIADRIDSRPSWSPLDTALAAGVVLGFALVPEALFLITLHL